MNPRASSSLVKLITGLLPTHFHPYNASCPVTAIGTSSPGFSLQNALISGGSSPSIRFCTDDISASVTQPHSSVHTAIYSAHHQPLIIATIKSASIIQKFDRKLLNSVVIPNVGTILLDTIRGRCRPDRNCRY